MNSYISSDPEPENAAGIARAVAAHAFGAEIARGGYYTNKLFVGTGATRVRLSDPIRPVSHLFVARLMQSRASTRFIEQLFSAVHEAAPTARLIAFEFADYPGFTPNSDDSHNFANHRTMAVRVARYRGIQRVETSQWLELPHALPWPYFRDVLIPFAVTRQGVEAPGFAQVFHGAIFSPLQHWLRQAFASDELCFTAFCAEAGTGILNSNLQDQGGGIIPVTPSIALTGQGMSTQMKDALRRWAIDLVEVAVPTETEHVDELFSVLPDPGATCGRALIVLAPIANDNEQETMATIAGITRTTRLVRETLRRKPGLEDIRTFELPVRIAGRNAADFNPVNMLSVPVDNGVLCLLGRPNEPSAQAEHRDALERIGDSLGYRIDTCFVDLRGVVPDHIGSLHCATVDVREA